MMLRSGKTCLICLLAILFTACQPGEPKHPTRVGERIEEGQTGIVTFGGRKSSVNTEEYIHASTLLRQGKIAESIDIYKRLCKIENSELKPYAYMALGTAYMQQLDYQKALVSYQTSLRMDTTDPEAYVGTGSAYLSLKKYDSAINYYHQALRINPKTSNGYWGLAVTYYTMKKMDSAKRYAQQFLNVEPGTKLRPVMEDILNR
jgi:tetratricopeptide (TPR) repeat protein